MSSAPRGSALAALCAALLAAGCAVPESRRHESQAFHALPEPDPATRGTVQGQHLPLSQGEQLVVNIGRDAYGNLVLLNVLSPALTPEQVKEVQRAFDRGEWRRRRPSPQGAGPWIEVLVPSRPEVTAPAQPATDEAGAPPRGDR